MPGEEIGGDWWRFVEGEDEEEVEPPDRPEVGPSLKGKNGARLLWGYLGATWVGDMR